MGYRDILELNRFGFGCIVILLRPNRFALGVLSFASAKESTKEKQPGGPFLLKGPPRLLQRAGAFSQIRENARTHKVTFEDPPTRALTRTTAGLLHVLVFLRFLLSVTILS